MADPVLYQLVLERLTAQPPPVDGAADLVLTAFEGPRAVERALGEGGSAAAQAPSPPPRPETPPSVHLHAIEVEGFRGIGPAATLALEPGPGLTLVVGRNGSGKSSFAEALEALLTGSSRRWSERRSKVWSTGWRNLHHPATRIAARFSIDGRPRPLRLERAWAEAEDVGSSVLTVDGRPVGSTEPVAGWDRALAAHRPLLSHNELGHILDDSPSKLYDSLSSILGLEDLAGAQELLRVNRLAAEHHEKETKARALELRSRLAQVDDERAATSAAALSGRAWNLGAIERALGASAAGVEEFAVLSRLRALTSLQVIDREAVASAAGRLREIGHQLERLGGSDSAMARSTARLLEQALAVHTAQEGHSCPVCGTEGVLTFEWRRLTGERIAALRREAEEAEAVHRRAADARRAAVQLLIPPPTALSEGAAVTVDTGPALDLWRRWAERPETDDPVALAIQLEGRLKDVIAAVAAVRQEAAAELERREDRWRPAARALAEWLPAARTAIERDPGLRRLRAAESWLRDAHDAIQADRFRPIADRVHENWSLLRRDSNVSIDSLELEGTGASSRRRLALDASVDGAAGSALGVMSQGELNCLALSLFLPRAAMPESPFRFLVIDDPVQAMDPAKVEGLARVLEMAARDRQVIVLTHDERLPETVRQLDIPATIVEVTRRERSIVETRVAGDPVQHHLDDARALALSRLPPAIARLVIPGFCRLALESACAVAVRRRMHARGAGDGEIEATLRRPVKLLQWLALLFYGDVERAGDVLGRLDNRGWGWAADAVVLCNRGSHGEGGVIDLRQLVGDCERLARELARYGTGG